MNDKQLAILDAALKVFARYGLKKTSIDDIAKASDISRQGVYLHFKNKEEIFKASVEKFLSDRNEASLSALAVDLPLDQRLLAGLHEWFGKNIGFFHQDATDIIEGAAFIKPAYDALAKEFKTALSNAVQKEAKASREAADDIAEILSACGVTWKHEMTSQEEFQSRMMATIHLLLSGLSKQKQNSK